LRYASGQTNRQTYRHADRNTSPAGGEVTNIAERVTYFVVRYCVLSSISLLNIGADLGPEGLEPPPQYFGHWVYAVNAPPPIIGPEICVIQCKMTFIA